MYNMSDLSPEKNNQVNKQLNIFYFMNSIFVYNFFFFFKKESNLGL